MDMGSYVVIINAEKVKVTGNKEQQKMYYRHTGRPGSLKEENFKKLQAVSGADSFHVLQEAGRGADPMSECKCMPANMMGAKVAAGLYIFCDSPLESSSW